MTNGKPNHRSVMAATLTASILMLAFGLTYRVIAAQLQIALMPTPIASDALAVLPMQVGNWQGQDVPLDDTIARRTGTDAHINRQYSRRDDTGSVCLYLASGVKTQALIGHRPETCYTAAGWTLSECRLLDLLLTDGTKLPCTVFRFARGGLDLQDVIVLNYFIVDGQPFSDVSVLRSRAGRRLAGVAHIAQVQVVASTKTPTADSSAELVRMFARESAPSIARLFENLENGGAEDAARQIQEGQ